MGMQDLIALVLAVVQAAALQRARPSRARRLCVAAGVAGLVLCYLVASACLLTALWLFLLPRVGEVGAPLVIAGLLVVKALVILAWLRFGQARAAQPSPAEISPSVLLAEVDRLFKAHKGSAVAAALLVGLMAGGAKK